MKLKIIAALMATTMGIGLAAPAVAQDWRGQSRHTVRDGDRSRHDGVRMRDGDRRDMRHHGWDQGRHQGWRDRNHDGRVDRRDHPRFWGGHDRDGRDGPRHGQWRDRDHRGGRDSNGDGRVDWRDRRFDRIDRNHDGRLDRQERSFWRADRNHDGAVDFREWRWF